MLLPLSPCMKHHDNKVALGAITVHKTWHSQLQHTVMPGAAVCSAPARVKWTATSCAGSERACCGDSGEIHETVGLDLAHIALILQQSLAGSQACLDHPSHIESERKERSTRDVCVSPHVKLRVLPSRRRLHHRRRSPSPQLLTCSPFLQ